jgi:tRNA (guanine9-N1)-methyltransferase
LNTKAQVFSSHITINILVVLDCSFDDQMTEKERKSLANQLMFSYSSNNKAKFPLRTYITSLGGKLKEQLDKISGFKNWKKVFSFHSHLKFLKITIETKHYLELFKKEDLVYLTSDSNEALKTIDPNKVYIIGAMVDHNRLKV